MKSSGSKELLEAFRLHRKLTLDLLLSLDNEQLTWRPIKATGSFGKQFRHLLDVQRSYVDSMFTGVLDFLRSDIDHALENDRGKLLESLREEDRRLESGLSNIPTDELLVHSIDCSRVVKYLRDDNSTASIAKIISWMTEHEIFHEGELALYVRSARMKFPGSWIIWGLR